MGKKQPAHEIKLGKIRVTIWANETEDHDVWFTAVVTRLYKTGNTWKETTTLKHDDLPHRDEGDRHGLHLDLAKASPVAAGRA